MFYKPFDRDVDFATGTTTDENERIDSTREPVKAHSLIPGDTKSIKIIRISAHESQKAKRLQPIKTRHWKVRI